MKIVSRPEDMVVGEGAYTMKLEFEELQFIGALLYMTRLGDTVYKEAAFNILNNIEELFDEDFIDEAAADVSLAISVLDGGGDIIEQHPYDRVVIEV